MDLRARVSGRLEASETSYPAAGIRVRRALTVPGGDKILGATQNDPEERRKQPAWAGGERTGPDIYAARRM